MDMHEGSCRDRGSQTHNKQGQIFWVILRNTKSRAYCCYLLHTALEFPGCPDGAFDGPPCIRGGMIVHLNIRDGFSDGLKYSLSSGCGVCILVFQRWLQQNLLFHMPFRSLFATPHHEMESNYPSLESGWASDSCVTNGTSVTSEAGP